MEVLGGEQHHVANLELLVAMVGIIVPLLVRLSLLQLLPSFLHECLDLLGHVSYPHRHSSTHNNINRKSWQFTKCSKSRMLLTPETICRV